MKSHILEREQRIDMTPTDVFRFFERPENLAKITPPAMRFRILTPGPIKMAAGTLIDYTIRIFGIRRRWTTLISTYDPPREFIDVQLRGPYAFWQHTHRFEEITSGTRVVDRVEYIVPFGVCGHLINLLVIRRQLNRIFDYRERRIGEIFARERSLPSDPVRVKG